MKKTILILVAFTLGVASLEGHDLTQWGGANSRNMVSSEKGLPVDFSPGEMCKDSEDVDMATTKNCLWVAKLGSTGLVPPAIVDGRIYVGTNNYRPDDFRTHVARGSVVVFDEKTGSLQWQLLPGGDLKEGTFTPFNFIRSMPTIVGDKGYLVTNLAEIVCFSTKSPAAGKIAEVQPGTRDPNIIWVYDMVKELGVSPYNMLPSWPGAPWPSPLVVNGKVYVATTNGVDLERKVVPAPQAPSFICVDAETGKFIAQIPAAEKISERTTFCNCSSASYAEVNGKGMILFAAGDGFVYGLGLAEERQEAAKGVFELPVKCKYDAVPKEYRLKSHYLPDGPSGLIGTPVVVDGKCYAAIGDNMSRGLGMLSCFDITQTGDLSGKAIWTFRGLERTVAAPAVKDGLVYAVDFGGMVFCLDAKTGEEFWRFDTTSIVAGSPLAADGKVYVGNDDGDLFIFAEGKQLKRLGNIEFPSAILAPAVAANGVLYITTQGYLYAFQNGAVPTP